MTDYDKVVEEIAECLWQNVIGETTGRDWVDKYQQLPEDRKAEYGEYAKKVLQTRILSELIKKYLAGELVER